MKSDQRVILTKRLLREGLLKLLERKNIDEIRVCELCDASGINRATFYRHYTQPRDILRDIRQSIVEDVQILAEQTRAEEDLAGWLKRLCQYFYDNRKLLCILFETRTDEEFAQMVSQLCNQQLSRLQHTPLGELDEESVRLMAYGYAGGFYYILRQWLLEPGQKTPEEVAGVMHCFLTGH